MLFVSDKLFSSDLNSVRVRPLTYISWVVVLLEACDITNNGHHLGAPPWILLRLRNQVKTVINGFVLYVRNNTNKNFAWFQSQDLLFLLKKGEKACTFIQNGLTTCYLIYFVTIETAHHWTFLKMCVRDKQKATETIKTKEYRVQLICIDNNKRYTVKVKGIDNISDEIPKVKTSHLTELLGLQNTSFWPPHWHWPGAHACRWNEGGKSPDSTQVATWMGSLWRKLMQVPYYMLHIARR